MDVEITTSITPLFNQIGPLCQNSSAPDLPVTSTNGISGTWNPAAINTSVVGTFTYTFTPDDGQCAEAAAMTVEITTERTPTFTPIGPLVLNSNAPDLPTSSLEGITGTWNPSAISTNAAGTTTYTFVPAPGQCAVSTTMDITVISQGLSISKTADVTSYQNAGDLINYTITVTNNGDVILTNINVTDPLTGLNQTIATLDPGESRTFNTTYSITQADIDAGLVHNTATAAYTYAGEDYTQQDEVTIPATQGPALTISKTADISSYQNVGDAVNYTIVVTNTGNVILTNISVTDPLTGLNQTIATLDPGESRTFNTTYSITQADIDAGLVHNTATAAYTYAGEDYTQQDEVTVNAAQGPALTISKTADVNSFRNAGDVINYTITVTNTGNVILTNINVTDPLTGLNQTITSLAPGESRTINTSYTTVQNDVNSGRVDNTASARFTFGGTEYTESDNETVPANQAPSIEITKVALESSYSRAGEVIHYTLSITNTGNVTLTNVVASDPNAVVTCNGSPYTLAPRATATCTAIHTVTDADMISGSVVNTALVVGYDPSNQRVTDNSNTVTVRLNNLAPSLVCPPSISTFTSPTTCDRFIDSGLSATYSDPNNNIVSLTWVMTGATNANSPATGINNLTSYTFNAGVTTVTYTVTDAGGLTASCSFTVTVIDNIPPIITCVGNQDRSTDLTRPVYTTIGTEFDPVSLWENCTIASLINDFNEQSTLAGAAFPIGTTTVIWTVTDNSGLSSSCSFTVTVTDDVNPVARCKNITIYLDLVTGLVSITPIDIDAGSFDNVAIASMTIDRDKFNCSDLGDNDVTLTVTDIYGNTGSCTAIVTVMYSALPSPAATPAEDILCNKETTDIALTSNIPATAWTWTVNSPAEITGAAPDNTGTLSYIRQTLTNSSPLARNVIYTITPTVYGRCVLDPLTASVWVNPTPEIIPAATDTIICFGASTTISVVNPNTSVRGTWMYDLTVTPDPGIGGNRGNGTFTEPATFTETLTNSDTEIRKVVYRFTPRIQYDNSGAACSGPAEIITIWVRPAISYTREISDFNGYNVSCYGKSDGFIRLTPSPDAGPLTILWMVLPDLLHQIRIFQHLWPENIPLY